MNSMAKLFSTVDSISPRIEKIVRGLELAHSFFLTLLSF